MLKVIQPGWSRSFRVVDVPGRHHGGVEDVHGLVVGVGEPQLLLVGREADAVARTAVPRHRAFLESRDLDAVQLLPGPQVADLEAQQVVDVHVAARLRGVDRERPDRSRERAHGFDHVWVLGSATNRSGECSPAR